MRITKGWIPERKPTQHDFKIRICVSNEWFHKTYRTLTGAKHAMTNLTKIYNANYPIELIDLSSPAETKILFSGRLQEWNTTK